VCGNLTTYGTRSSSSTSKQSCRVGNFQRKNSHIWSKFPLLNPRKLSFQKFYISENIYRKKQYDSNDREGWKNRFPLGSSIIFSCILVAALNDEKDKLELNYPKGKEGRNVRRKIIKAGKETIKILENSMIVKGLPGLSISVSIDGETVLDGGEYILYH